MIVTRLPYINKIEKALWVGPLESLTGRTLAAVLWGCSSKYFVPTVRGK